MAILIMFAILWTPYAVTVLLLRALHARRSTPAQPRQTCAEPLSGLEAETGSQDEPAWSALDDRQLTRLLTDSAPRTITE